MTKKSQESHHVVAGPKGGWSVKKGGSTRASRTFQTKVDAVKHGKAVSKNQGTEFYIHRKDGTIQHKATHGGRDPNPLRGRDTHK